MELVLVEDRFNIAWKTYALAAARPSDRPKLLRYIKNYVMLCENEDNKLRSLRMKVNRP